MQVKKFSFIILFTFIILLLSVSPAFASEYDWPNYGDSYPGDYDILNYGTLVDTDYIKYFIFADGSTASVTPYLVVISSDLVPFHGIVRMSADGNSYLMSATGLDDSVIEFSVQRYTYNMKTGECISKGTYTVGRNYDQTAFLGSATYNKYIATFGMSRNIPTSVKLYPFVTNSEKLEKYMWQIYLNTYSQLVLQESYYAEFDSWLEQIANALGSSGPSDEVTTEDISDQKDVFEKESEMMNYDQDSYNGLFEDAEGVLGTFGSNTFSFVADGLTTLCLNMGAGTGKILALIIFSLTCGIAVLVIGRRVG